MDEERPCFEAIKLTQMKESSGTAPGAQEATEDNDRTADALEVLESAEESGKS